MGPEVGTPNADNLAELRQDITNLLVKARKYQETMVAPAVQEQVLAVRHLEDARMRLGVALTYVNGQAPFGE